MVLVNTGLRRAIGAGINKGLSFFAPLKTEITLARGTGSPTYTRATTAYVQNNDGYLVQALSGEARFTGARRIRNFTQGSSNDLSNASWIKRGTCSITSTTIADPDGVAIASRVAGLGTLGTSNDVYQAAAGALLGVGHTPQPSFYIKRVSTSGVVCYTNSANDASGRWNIDLAALPDSWVLITRQSPYISVVAEFVAHSGIYCAPLLAKSSGAGTLSVDVCRFQIEDVTGQTTQTAGEYVSVGVLSAPYHGAGVDGVKYFETDATGAAIADATLKGYFAEGQRTNRCLYSQDFTNAAWVSGGGGIAVTPNTAVAPDGTTTADTLTASGANGTLIQDLGVVASAAKAGGLYLKRKTGTGNIDLTLDGGATWTTVAVTSDWLMLEKTQTLADEDFGIRIVTSGDEVYAWQGQVETAAFISSPIPTTTAAVTRNEDNLSYQRSGNMDLSVGTLYAEFTTAPLIGAGHFLLGIDGANQIIATGPTHNRTSSYDNVTPFNSNIGGYFDAGVVKKAAVTWQSSGRTMSYDGTAVTSGAFKGAWTDDSIKIGRNPNGSGDVRYAFGNIRNVKIWTTAKTDAQLQALTT